jgi:A/G-specific adenine glycosylase
MNLHRCAAAMVERHGGTVPDDLDALLALPGIGPYTARAVLVFAFEHDLGLVDTNAGRFVSRALAGRRLTPVEAQATADAAVPPGDGWRWGQAVFDLGAAVCTKRAPACDRCPLAAGACAWAAEGFPDPDPVVGSAGISAPQPRFEGSDRQGRGRLVAALRAGPVTATQIGEAAGWPADPARAAEVASRLVAEGLVSVDVTGTLRLL